MICEECGVEYGDDVWFCPKCAVMLSRSDAKIPTVDTDAASEDKPDIQTNVNKDTQNDAHISHTAQDFEQPGFRPQPSGRVEAEYKIIESETVENEQFNTFEDRIARKTNQIAYKLDLLLIQALAKIRGNQMEIPDFLKLYFARKLRIMLTMVLICIIGIFITAALQSNAGKPAVFTTHSELEAGINIVTSVFYLIFYAAMLVFISLSIIYGVIFIYPEKSYTWKFVAQYGDAAFLFSECDRSITGQITETNPLKPKGRIINSEFIILAYPLHVYIAPLKELLWAYIAFNVETGGRGAARTYYSIIYRFTSGERKAVRIEHKNDGIKELAKIKNLNPHVLIGFNHELLSMYEKDFDAFKQQVYFNVGQLQANISAGEHANIHSDFWGLGTEYK